ncbi:hypothetical protein BDN72DRAFT_961433 [Pluteus cervinus]|uniref:Uncharacterized protein n=1 Tax=Pluteus cervinus TaxID=181527 RepID=A0ACD3AMM5_9AGAR|nr:hypothetical protein BDN72DRAFT_961433 [Pluteus cervinus]
MVTLVPELIREIIEIAVGTDLGYAAKFALVSRDFYEWAHPILCRTLMYYATSETKHWPVPLHELPQWLELNGKHVRSMMWGIDTTNLPSLLEQCPGLTNLALWVNTSSNDITTLLPILSTLHLSRLSIDLWELFDRKSFSELEARHAAFRAVTHLDVVHRITEWEDLQGITALPCLTHLCFPRRTMDSPYSSVIRSALEECKHLKVLAIASGSSFPSGNPIRVAQTNFVLDGDPRLVAFDCEYVGDWECGAIGKKDIWALADEIVEQRFKDIESPRSVPG